MFERDRQPRSGRGRWLLGAVTAVAVMAAAGIQAQGTLKAALNDDFAPHWLYDDLPKAVEQAKASGKPILAVLRCVP
jgi:serine protease Do